MAFPFFGARSRHLEGMTIMENASEVAGNRAFRSNREVMDELRGAISRGYRRLLVAGPSGSQRLALTVKALESVGRRVCVIDLGRVRSRRDLDRAVRRATRRVDFYSGMRSLERVAQRLPMGIVFHDLDGCFGSPGEAAVIYRVWSEAVNHCRSSLVAFTARNPEFCARCFETLASGRTTVYRSSLIRKEDA